MTEHADAARDAAARMRRFICSNFYVSEEERFGDDESLLERGIVDSTGILEVIAFLETEFGVKVADEEMLPENLDSIERIVAFVGRKTGAATIAERGAG